MAMHEEASLQAAHEKILAYDKLNDEEKEDAEQFLLDSLSKIK